MKVWLVLTHTHGEFDVSYTLHSEENFTKLQEIGGYDDDNISDPLEINGKRAYFGDILKLFAFVKANNLELVDSTDLWSDG